MLFSSTIVSTVIMYSNITQLFQLFSMNTTNLLHTAFCKNKDRQQ